MSPLGDRTMARSGPGGGKVVPWCCSAWSGSDPSFGLVWSYELVSLSDGLVGDGPEGFLRLTADYQKVEDEGLLPWATPKPGLVMRVFPERPFPERLMPNTSPDQGIRTAVSACQFDGQGRERAELRLLPHPIDRYSAPSSGLIDGAISCCLRHKSGGLLVIEARPRGQSTAQWEYGLTHLTGGRPSVSLDRKEVWHPIPVGGMAPDDSYISRVLVPKRAKP